MYIEPNEMDSKIYRYQLNQITEGKEMLVTVAIETAIEEASSYIGARFDLVKTFSAQGKDRNPHLVNIVKSIALWQIIQLSNVDILYNRIREEYDRAIEWLNRVSIGRVSPQLPIKENLCSSDFGITVASDKKLKNNY